MKRKDVPKSVEKGNLFGDSHVEAESSDGDEAECPMPSAATELKRCPAADSRRTGLRATAVEETEACTLPNLGSPGYRLCVSSFGQAMGAVPRVDRNGPLHAARAGLEPFARHAADDVPNQSTLCREPATE